MERNLQIDVNVACNNSMLAGNVLDSQVSSVISQFEVVEASLHPENINETPTKEEFNDSDYDLPLSDEDYKHVINEQRAKKKEGRLANVPFVNPTTSLTEDLDVGKDNELEYASSDDLFTELESYGEGLIRFVDFNEERDLYNPRLRLGLVFRNFDQFKQAYRNWGIKNRFQLWFP